MRHKNDHERNIPIKIRSYNERNIPITLNSNANGNNAYPANSMHQGQYTYAQQQQQHRASHIAPNIPIHSMPGAARHNLVPAKPLQIEEEIKMPMKKPNK